MMSEISQEPKFTLRLIVDIEKNKVVLAESCRDFVDVLFSFLTLPMGTIVRLLENHRKPEPVTVGCFNNLYRSVSDVSIDNFQTQACKEMLLYPRSLRDVQCKRLKLNINPNEGDHKFFRCRYFSGCTLCSSFSSSDCACGNLMNLEIEKDQVSSSVSDDVDGVFVRGRSSFIITDDLKVSVGSTDLVLKTINRLGCSDVSKLGEHFLDIGLKEIMTLLEYIISSSTPLTDTFLKKRSQDDVKKNIHKLLSPFVSAKTDVAEPEFTVDAIVRKQDMKVLYLECGEDFVDLLFTFLAVPLDSLWDINLGCIGNLRRSFKDLSVNKGKEDSASKCVLPYYYKCKNQFSDITTEKPPVYYRYMKPNLSHILTTDSYQTRNDGQSVSLVAVTVIDPKCHGRDQSENSSSGFVKRGTRFTVSDDMIITPSNSLSTSICYLKKLQVKANELDREAAKGRDPVRNMNVVPLFCF